MNACETPQEKRLIIYGKGGPYGSKSKRRIIPMTERAYAVLSAWFSLSENIGTGPRNISTRTLQQLLGHDHLATTEIYLNLSPEDACREFISKH
ncbi:hypothetical protein COS91_05530 [Candidatus Desantisbacteria bacterium CG07_land_8_20_14_0_80_39_15]|uniref:Tyr recombinase domain-containing protein n=2 Tax=unclassified Candidatus Desantisiibacteriota TaxID=3106372 RepID=A0A2H9PDI6_9BACT|nr:MAG: hypothetical protein COS91_05530 [Candidatus Desantisbacteria bacterium CG07_land_8_20_14_0_80_39_15]PIZ16514.1 MAG: hypothetical protein COY51_02640 [Candidatus Desantisbacteria bacterium CG_4_10_14_0_8_um_filter_39_17]